MDKPLPPESNMKASVTPLFPNASGREHKWFLNEQGQPMPISDALEWANWMQDNRRNNTVHSKHSGLTVSTVFLGLDHSFREKGPPVLWETMLFSNRRSRKRLNFVHQWRYVSKDDAMKLHSIILKTVKSGRCPSWVRKRLDEL